MAVFTVNTFWRMDVAPKTDTYFRVAFIFTVLK